MDAIDLKRVKAMIAINRENARLRQSSKMTTTTPTPWKHPFVMNLTTKTMTAVEQCVAAPLRRGQKPSDMSLISTFPSVLSQTDGDAAAEAVTVVVAEAEVAIAVGTVAAAVEAVANAKPFAGETNTQQQPDFASRGGCC